MAYHEMLPQEILDLQNELKNWPMISAEAAKCGSFTEQLGTIAARLQILLDGVYDPLDLCRMLTKKLYEMRTTTIIPFDPEMKEVRIKVGENEVVLEDIPTPQLLIPSPKQEDSQNQEAPPHPLSSSCSDSEET